MANLKGIDRIVQTKIPVQAGQSKPPQPSTEHKNPADQGNLLYKRNLEKDIRFLSFPLLLAAL